MKYIILERIHPYISFFETYADNRSFIKPLSNKIGEIFSEGLKRVCKLFEKNGQKDL